MADIAGEIVGAPKTVVKFGEQHLVALVLLVMVLAVLFVAAESRRPGVIASKVARIPALGSWATRRPSAAM